jgi:dolichyl-phosphate beta-glucosyltransferase
LKKILIIPCYNEAKRLKLQNWVSLSSDTLKIVFANDGSNDETASLIKNEVVNNQNIFLYDHGENIGKGPVIRKAYEYIIDQSIFQREDIVGYFDADFSTPSCEIINLLSYFEKNTNLDALFGSRIKRLGADIVRYESRHLFGRLFSFVVQLIFGLDAHDTQCGAKLFRYESARLAFADDFVSRWIFDIEIILRLQSNNIEEFPLKKWHHAPGSKFNIAKSIFSVLKDLWIIKTKYKKT